MQKYIIVGLGNPGKEYENNRHNIGFLILDKIKKQFPISNFQFPISFLKPQTFMNQSGSEVKRKADYFRIKTEDIFVIHDDLDLNFGTVRVSFGSGSAGHNGVQSVIDELATTDFWRIRVGIGRPPENVPAEKFVLQDFTNQEKKQLPKIIDQTAQNMLTLISDPKEATIKIVGANLVD